MRGPTKKLNNGVEMPTLGFGVFQSDGDFPVSAIKTALTEGYRLLDTATLYKTEQEVGQAVRESEISRDDVFIQSKVWFTDLGHDATLRSFDLSMERLGLDVIDSYMIHWPAPKIFEKTIESWKVLIRLKEEGRVRSIGVCNFRPVDLNKLIDVTGVTPATNQVELHPGVPQEEIRKFNQKLGIATQAWSPIGGVTRYNNYPPKQVDPLQEEAIIALSEKHSKSPAQIILRWHIQLGNSVIPRSSNPTRIRDNINIFDFELSDEDMAAIATLDKGGPASADPAEVGP